MAGTAPKQKKPRTRLTHKQRIFVQEYLKTGNGTQSALQAYDTQDGNTARSIASENLTKPAVSSAIQSALDDTLLNQKHMELFSLKRVDYFVFPKKMEDEEIVAHVKAAGIDVITVREGDRGKFAFYSLPDAQAIKGALEISHKIKGTFAPEKSLNVNVEVEASSDIIDMTKKLNDVYRGAGEPSNGADARPVGNEASDKERGGDEDRVQEA